MKRFKVDVDWLTGRMKARKIYMVVIISNDRIISEW